MRSGAMGDVPDRAARIRALAERMYLADLCNSGSQQYWPSRGIWREATERLDELDRLEAEEREKEADRE